MNIVNSNILTVITLLPVLGMILVLLTPSKSTNVIKWGSIAFSLIPLALSVVVWLNYDQTRGSYQFIESMVWFPQVNATYKVGVDGISLPLVALTCFLTPLAMIISTSVDKGIKAYFALFFLLEASVIGVFISLDLILFFLFYEISLVPMYFLINQWGGANRRYASLKFFLYTMFASLGMLLAIQVIGLASGSFDITYLESTLGRPFTGDNQVNIFNWDPGTWKAIAFITFSIAFALKIPIWPLHTWLPDAHTEAPTGGSMMLAGILLKLGGYGFLRLVIPFFPDVFSQNVIPGWAVTFGQLLAILALFSIVLGAFAAWGQTDFKKLVAYSSINHMGFVAMGIAATAAALAPNATVREIDAQIAGNGAVFQMVTHGLSSAAMFALVGVVYERTHTRDLTRYGGLWTIMPIYGAILIFCSMGSLGLPGLAGFVSEFMVIRGSWSIYTLYTILAMAGLLVTGIYILKALQKVLHGPVGAEWMGADGHADGHDDSHGHAHSHSEGHAHKHALKDINFTEILGIAPLMGAMLVLGIYPAIALNLINVGVQGLFR
jgi:NADH-quinone oxidoreductase subunit M